MTLFMRVFKEGPEWIFSIDSAFLFIFYYALGDFIMPYAKDFEYKKLPALGKAAFWIFAAGSAVFTVLLYFGFPYTPGQFGLNIPETIDRAMRVFIAVGVIFLLVLLSRLLGKARYIQAVGRTTLILSGCEKMSSVAFVSLLSALGIDWQMHSVPKTFIYCAVFMTFCYLVFGLGLKTLFPFVFSRKAKTKESAAGTGANERRIFAAK